MLPFMARERERTYNECRGALKVIFVLNKLLLNDRCNCGAQIKVFSPARIGSFYHNLIVNRKEVDTYIYIYTHTHKMLQQNPTFDKK